MMPTVPGSPRLPRVNRVDFYRMNGAEFLALLAHACRKFVDGCSDRQLSADHAALVAFSRMHSDVPNGGFEQFFFNHHGEGGIERAAELLDALEAPKAAAVARDAREIYRKHRGAFAVEDPFSGLFGSIPEFAPLDRRFCAAMTRGVRALEVWARSNAGTMFVGDDGEPVDPAHTGTVLAVQAEDAITQSLEVRNGKPSGLYRETLSDGTARYAAIYRGSERTECWPSGQPRRREVRRDRRRIIEWFHKSGALHKRCIADRSGNLIEPVHLYHENGQLAEVAHVQATKDVGPWLRYFKDGSPKLVADRRADGTLIVHDAWNEERCQMVRGGNGIFHDDGRRITVSFDLCFESDWVHRVEVRGGLAHGTTTTWFRGALWSITHFEHGCRHGDEILYWDNGRVRAITPYVHGQAGAARPFPKFDHPQPAVRLQSEANGRLYEAWGLRALDEYPRPINLPDVQGSLVVPPMLREIHERNQSGTSRSQYEDPSLFTDGITYAVRIDEAGAVRNVRFNGSGVASIGLVATYPPLIQALRFRAGRLRGRAVPCQAIVIVEHTFVEGSDPGAGHRTG